METQVPPEQLYQGGAAVGVSCCSCGATATSGSWRKGWIAPDTELAVNLCNRCGQRWAKCGRPTLQPGQELVPRRPPVGGSGGARGGGSAAVRATASRAAVGGGKNGSHAGALGGSLLSGRPGSRDEGPFSHAPRVEGSRYLNGSSEALAPATSASGAGASSGSGALSSIPSAACPLWTHERVSRGRAQHVLFWVHTGVDAADCRLACVGTDTRSSGHYVYASLHGFRGPADDAAAEPPALSATNRADVAAWLAERGVRLAPAEARLAAPDGAESLERAVVQGRILLPQQGREAAGARHGAAGYTTVEHEGASAHHNHPSHDGRTHLHQRQYQGHDGAVQQGLPVHDGAAHQPYRAHDGAVARQGYQSHDTAAHQGYPSHEVSFSGSAGRYPYHAAAYVASEASFDRAPAPASPDAAGWARAARGLGSHGTGSPATLRGSQLSPQRSLPFATYSTVPSPDASGYRGGGNIPTAEASGYGGGIPTAEASGYCGGLLTPEASGFGGGSLTPEASGFGGGSLTPSPEHSQPRLGASAERTCPYPYGAARSSVRFGGAEAAFARLRYGDAYGVGRFSSSSTPPQPLTQQASVSSVGSHAPQRPSTPGGSFCEALPVFVSCREADEWTFDGRRRRAIYLVLSDGSERLAATIRERDPTRDGPRDGDGDGDEVGAATKTTTLQGGQPQRAGTLQRPAQPAHVSSLIVQATPEMGGAIFNAPDELSRWIRSAMGKRPPRTPMGVVSARAAEPGCSPELGFGMFARGGAAAIAHQARFDDAEDGAGAGRPEPSPAGSGRGGRGDGDGIADGIVDVSGGVVADGSSPIAPVEKSLYHPVPPVAKGGKLRPSWVACRDAASRDASLEDVDAPHAISANKASVGKPSPAALTLAPASHALLASSAFSVVFPDSPCDHPLASPSTILTARDGAAFEDDRKEEGRRDAKPRDGFSGDEFNGAAVAAAAAAAAHSLGARGTSPALPSTSAAGLDDATSLSHLTCGRRLSSPQTFLLSPRGLVSPRDTPDSPQSYGLLCGFGADVFGASEIEAFDLPEGTATRAASDRGSPMPGAGSLPSSSFMLSHGAAPLRASSLRPAGLFSRPESRLTPHAPEARFHGESRLATPLSLDGSRLTPLSLHASMELPSSNLLSLDPARHLGISPTSRLSGDSQSLLLDECTSVVAAAEFPPANGYAPSRLGDGASQAAMTMAETTTTASASALQKRAGASPTPTTVSPKQENESSAAMTSTARKNADEASDKGPRSAAGFCCEKRESETPLPEAAKGEARFSIAAADSPGASKSPKRPRVSSSAAEGDPEASTSALAEPSCLGEPRTPGAASRLSRHRNSSEEGTELEEEHESANGERHAQRAAMESKNAGTTVDTSAVQGTAARAPAPLAEEEIAQEVVEVVAKAAPALPPHAALSLSATSWASRLDAVSTSSSPTAPLLEALSALADAPLPLPSIEASGLAVRVAALRRHADANVASAALAVSARWRARALGALKAARDHHAPGPLGKSCLAPRQTAPAAPAAPAAPTVQAASTAQAAGGANARATPTNVGDRHPQSPQSSPQTHTRVVGAC